MEKVHPYTNQSQEDFDLFYASIKHVRELKAPYLSLRNSIIISQHLYDFFNT